MEPRQDVTPHQMKAALLNSPCTHRWLKEQLKEAQNHDIVDQLYDCMTLLEYLEKRASESGV